LAGQEVVDLAEGYINYQQVEELLKSYHVIESMINSLQVELQTAYIEGMEESDNEVIYALVVGNRQLDGVPKPPYRFFDKTFNIMYMYKKEAANTNNAKIKRLSREILELSMVLEKIDIAINCLDLYQQEVVNKLYIPKKVSPAIIDYVEERRIKRERRKVLETMATVMRLPEEVYYKVMEKITKKPR
jgi:hypothetical protein